MIGKKTTYILTEDDFNKYCDAVRSATAVNTQKAEIEDAKKRIDDELNELEKEKQLAEDAWKRALSVKSEYETRMARAREYELSAHDKELKQVELNKRYDIMIKLRDDEREKNKQLSAEIEQLNAQIDTIKQNHNKELDDKDSIIKSKDKVISEKDNEIKGLKDKVQFFSKKLKALLNVLVGTISGVNILFNGKDKYEKYRIDNVAPHQKNLFKAIFDTSSSVFNHVNDIFEDKFPSTYYADEIYKQHTLRHTRIRHEVLQRIEDGVSRSVFQQEFADAEKKFNDLEKDVSRLKNGINVYETMHQCAKIIYGNMECTNEQYRIAKEMMEIHPEITKDNYNDLIASIDDMSNQCVELEKKLDDAKSEYSDKEFEYDYADKIISEQEELNTELEDYDVLTM